MHTSIKLDTPVEFINITPLNPLISKCQIKVCYVGDEPNRNRSIITKEVATQMANSLPGSPIVGFYNEAKEDFEELEKHCKFKVVYKNIFAKLLKISSQIKGVKVISKTNGNSIFLPAAGEYVSFYNKKKPYGRGKSCYYWSSTPDLEEEGNVSAYCFFLSS